MSGRYNQHFPTLNRSYLSGGIQNAQAGNIFTYENIVSANRDANQSNVAVSAKSTTTIFKDVIQTNNFNVVQVSLDTLEVFNPSDAFLYVNINQGLEAKSLTNSYKTPVESRKNFFRNYPVKNGFCNITLENPTDSDLRANVTVTLSKFTQFNPPSQLGDDISFKEMTNLNRNANEFYDDVALNNFQSIEMINKVGSFSSITNTTPFILAPIPIVANTSNIYAEVQAKSDSILDAGYELEISGDIDTGVNGRFNNLIQLNGTSNSAISINKYKSVDTVNLFGNNNTGNISIFHTGTGKMLNYIPSGYANTSTVLYYVDIRAKAIVKEINLKGFSVLTNSKVRLRIIDGGTGVVTYWEADLRDGYIENSWRPDLLVNSNNTVYLEVYNEAGGTSIDMVGSLKLIKYFEDPEIKV